MDFDIITKFLPINVLILSIGVYILSLTAKRILKSKLNKSVIKKFMPLVPLAFGLGLTFVPGIFPDVSWGTKLLNGLLATFTASYLHEIIKKVAFGKLEIPGILNGVDTLEEEPKPVVTKPADGTN